MRSALIAIAVAGLGVAGCGSRCGGGGDRPNYQVRIVLSSASGEALRAPMAASDTLGPARCFATTGECTFDESTGAIQSGRHVVTLSAEGHLSRTVTVEVTQSTDSCGLLRFGADPREIVLEVGEDPPSVDAGVPDAG